MKLYLIFRSRRNAPLGGRNSLSLCAKSSLTSSGTSTADPLSETSTTAGSTFAAIASDVSVGREVYRVAVQNVQPLRSVQDVLERTRRSRDLRCPRSSRVACYDSHHTGRRSKSRATPMYKKQMRYLFYRLVIQKPVNRDIHEISIRITHSHLGVGRSIGPFLDLFLRRLFADSV